MKLLLSHTVVVLLNSYGVYRMYVLIVIYFLYDSFCNITASLKDLLPILFVVIKSLLFYSTLLCYFEVVTVHSCVFASVLFLFSVDYVLQ